MGKKFNLRQKAQSILQRQKEGSAMTRQEQQRIMNTIIDDLDRLRRLPRNFKLMTSDDIEHLVHFWKEKPLSIASIGNKLGVLRRFNQLAELGINIPNNKELDCIKASHSPLKITVPENYEETIFHPITQSIIALQCHFGLTKLEAIRLNSTGSGTNDALLIERTIAHNKKDRLIPIITTMQIASLNKWEKLSQTSRLLKQSDSNSLMLINKLYAIECHSANINPKTPFRHGYAQARLKILEKNQDKQSALLVLCKEMGFSSSHKLLAAFQ